MAGGNQLDAQREERWPGQTESSSIMGTTMKVIHKPWEENSDYTGSEEDQDLPNVQSIQPDDPNEN